MMGPQEEGTEWSRLFGGGAYNDAMMPIAQPGLDDALEDEMRKIWFWTAPSPYVSQVLGNKLTPYVGQNQGLPAQTGHQARPPLYSRNPLQMPGEIPGLRQKSSTAISVSHADDNGNSYRLSVSGGDAETLAKGLAAYAVLTGRKDIAGGEKSEKGYENLISVIKNYLGESKKAEQGKSDPYAGRQAFGRKNPGSDAYRGGQMPAAYRSLMARSSMSSYGARGRYGPRSSYGGTSFGSRYLRRGSSRGGYSGRGGKSTGKGGSSGSGGGGK